MTEMNLITTRFQNRYTSFQNKLYEKIEIEFSSRMDSLLKKYKESVDKKMAYYREQLEKYSPANFFNVSKEFPIILEK